MEVKNTDSNKIDLIKKLSDDSMDNDVVFPAVETDTIMYQSDMNNINDEEPLVVNVGGLNQEDTLESTLIDGSEQDECLNAPDKQNDVEGFTGNLRINKDFKKENIEKIESVLEPADPFPADTPMAEVSEASNIEESVNVVRNLKNEMQMVKKAASSVLVNIEMKQASNSRQVIDGMKVVYNWNHIPIKGRIFVDEVNYRIDEKNSTILIKAELQDNTCFESDNGDWLFSKGDSVSVVLDTDGAIVSVNMAE